MARSKPDLDVATALQTAGLGTLGTDLFVGLEQFQNERIPVAAIFVTEFGGPPPLPYMGTGTSWYEFGVQVLVRSKLQDWAAGQTKARSAQDAIHAQTITDSVNGTSYVLALSNQAAPVRIPETDTELPRWVCNFTLGQDF